jgi:hypothetical protein
MKRKYLLTLLVIIISAFEVISQNCNLIGNGNIESPIVVSTPGYYTSAQMGGWQTTSPDGEMELWNSGYGGVFSYSGAQYMEINGYYDSTLYQNITVSPGTNLAISFAHRGRGGVDTLMLSAGPVGGPYTILGYYADGNAAWGYYTVNYVVPNLGNNYSIRFSPVYAALQIQGYGNFIDSVTVCATNLGIHENINDLNSFSFSNPSDNNVVLNYFSEKPKQIVLIGIYSVTGALVKTKSFTAAVGVNKINFNLKELEAGIYFIKLTSGNRSSVKKWIKY